MHQQLPLVSIVMPTYNAAGFIAASIDSVCKQSFTNWELIIVDDGSVDDTAKVVKPYLRDKRIQYIVQKNQGQPKTRNKAMHLAKGSYIAFLDSDDIWLPEKLQQQMDIFTAYPEVGVCATCMSLITPQGAVFQHRPRKRFHGRALPGLVTQKISVGMSTAVVRKSIIEHVGEFDENHLPFSMDYDFWLRCALHCEFYIIEQCLTLYRTGHSSISKNNANARRDLVLNTVVPRFIKQYGGSRYVKWFHYQQLKSMCLKEQADEAQNSSHRLRLLLAALKAYPLQGRMYAQLGWFFIAPVYGRFKALIAKGSHRDR